MNMKDMVEFVKKHEGFRKDVYIDPLQLNRFTSNEIQWFKENRDTLNLTIGYGTLLEDIDDDLATVMAEHRLAQKINEVNREFKYLDITHEEVWDMLYMMSYQLGTTGIKKFKKMLEAIRVKDHRETYRQAMDSLWYSQTPNRAAEVIDLLQPLIRRM